MIETKDKYDLKSLYLREFQLFNSDGDYTMNIVDINTDKMTVTIALTDLGKIRVIEYDLKEDELNNLYFEFGIEREHISIDDFETVN